MGLGTSLAFLGDRPAIGFFDDPHVMYAESTTAMPSGKGDWEIERIETMGRAIDFRSLVVLQGHPVMSAASDGLYFARRE